MADIIVFLRLGLVRVHILEPSTALIRADGLSGGSLSRRSRRLDPRPVVTTVIVARVDSFGGLVDHLCRRSQQIVRRVVQQSIVNVWTTSPYHSCRVVLRSKHLRGGRVMTCHATLTRHVVIGRRGRSSARLLG